MLDKISSSMPTLGAILQLRAKKHEAITSNIANSETPNYKAADFSFADALSKARGIPMSYADSNSGGQFTKLNMASVQMTATSAAHFGPKKTSAVDQAVDNKFRNPHMAALDGNTVDLEQERALYAENMIKYEAAVNSMNGHIRTMKDAMSTR